MDEIPEKITIGIKIDVDGGEEEGVKAYEERKNLDTNFSLSQSPTACSHLTVQIL